MATFVSLNLEFATVEELERFREELDEQLGELAASWKCEVVTGRHLHRWTDAGSELRDPLGDFVQTITFDPETQGTVTIERKKRKEVIVVRNGVGDLHEPTQVWRNAITGELVEQL